MEFIRDGIFQYTPVFRGNRFASLVMLQEGASDSARAVLDMASKQEEVLCLCDYGTALKLASFYPRAWILGVAPMEAAEPAQPASAARFACVRSTCSLQELFVRLQALFIKMERWEKQTYDAILAGEGFQKILDLAESVFNNYMSLSNANFELVARTKNIPIDDPKALELIEKGRHSETTIAIFRASGAMDDWEKRSRVEETPPLLSGYPTLDYIYKRRGKYYMHLIMHCNNDPVSLGLADTFQMLVDYVGLYVKQSMESDTFAGNDFSLLMEDVMLHREVTRRALERRATAAGISASKEKRLMVFSFSDMQYNRAYLSYYARSISESFPWCEVGIYGSYVVAVGVWENADDRTVSSFEEFAEANPCLIGVSNTFTDIADLSLAFRQGKAVLEKMSDEQPSFASYYMPRRHNAVFLFEDYFVLCATDVMTKNELLRMSTQRGTIVRIARFDEQHGTDDLRILFFYLKNERDARKTSEELFMHRSTLLYRIKRLQDRFDIDLDDAKVRQRLTFEYFLCEKPEGAQA